MLFRPRNIGIFVVLLDYSTEKEAKEVVGLLTGIGFKNVTLLLQTSSGAVHIYTWFPYQPPSGNCGRFIDTVLLYSCQEGKLRLNPNRLEKSDEYLRSCKFQARSYDYPPLFVVNEQETIEGVNNKLMEIVSEKLNMTYSRRRYYNRLEDSIDVYFLLVDFSPLMFETFRSRVYFTLHMTFFVLHSEPYPRWFSLARVFSWASWFFIFLSLFLFSVSMALISRRGSYLINFFNAWSLILGISINNIPSNTSLGMILLAWILTSMCLNTIYQTFVTSYYIEPGYQHQIDSLEELHDLNIPLIFDGVTSISHVSCTKEESNNSVMLEGGFNSFKYFLLNPNSALFAYESLVRYCLKMYCGKDGGSKLHKFSKIFNQIHIKFKIDDNSLFHSKFNDIIARLVEGGFPGKFERDFSNPATMSFPYTQGFVTLSVSHIQSHLLLFFIGVSLSLLSFCLEILVYCVLK